MTGVSVRGYFKGMQCLYEDSNDCPDIDCSHNAITLENWYILGDLAPGKCRLVGVRSTDGHEVRTTTVVSAQGRVVQTQSGTVYLLGRVHPEFAAVLAEYSDEIDEEKPFGI